MRKRKRIREQKEASRLSERLRKEIFVELYPCMPQSGKKERIMTNNQLKK